MLNYLILTTKGLLFTAVITGLLYAWAFNKYGKSGYKYLHTGVLAGMIAAVIISYLKNTSSSIATGEWNLRIFTTSLIALAVLGIFQQPFLKKKEGLSRKITLIAAAVIAGTNLFYALPDIYAYPFNFSLGGAGIFSSAFFTRLVGWLLGILICVVAGIAACRAGKLAGKALLGGVLTAVLLINAVSQISKILKVLHQRRIISGSGIFKFITWTTNNADVFVYAGMIAAAVIPVVLWIRSFHVNEPYENPAQHRKIRAKWRSAKRWSATLIACFVMGILTFTVINDYVNRPVELSPVEESILEGDNVYVPLEQVDDGHLHRFAYTTPDNITVRFIVIKKPNSSSYGVGLDACDICGETGYFERDGQIVCKLCDVVMNINTIGFKGGCNPIVIDYSVEGGYIVVPTYTLIEHQDEFK